MQPSIPQKHNLVIVFTGEKLELVPTNMVGKKGDVQFNDPNVHDWMPED